MSTATSGTSATRSTLAAPPITEPSSKPLPTQGMRESRSNSTSQPRLLNLEAIDHDIFPTGQLGGHELRCGTAGTAPQPQFFAEEPVRAQASMSTRKLGKFEPQAQFLDTKDERGFG